MVCCVFWMMRHGEKQNPSDGSGLTELGRQQVRAAVRHHICRIHMDALLYSGIGRAREAAEVAIESLEQRHLVPQVELGFGFAEPDPEYPYLEIEKQVETCGRPETAALWMELAPPFQRMRETVQAMFCLRAVYHTAQKSPNDSERHILVLTHNPTAIIGALKPENTPGLRYADICRYVVVVDPTQRPRIASSEVLRAP